LDFTYLVVCFNYRRNRLFDAVPDISFVTATTRDRDVIPYDRKRRQSEGRVFPAAREKRRRSTLPILILAVLFVSATFLTWYYTWFGRELSDQEISNYLADEKHPRHVQHALLQIERRLDQGNSNCVSGGMRRSWS